MIYCKPKHSSGCWLCRYSCLEIARVAGNLQIVKLEWPMTMPASQPNHYAFSPRRPLVRICLVYAAGVWCAMAFERIDWRWALWGAAAALTVGLAVKLIRPARRGWPCLWVAWFLAGWCALGARLDVTAPQHLASLMQSARETVELRGQIAGNPVFQPDISRPPGRDGRPGVWRFDLDVSRIRRLPEWQTAQGRIRARLPGNDALRPQNGATWQLAGVLTDNPRRQARRRLWHWFLPADAGDAPAAPDWRRCPLPAAWRLAGRYTLQADPAAARLIAPARRWHLASWLYAWRERAGASLRRGLAGRPEVAQVLRALVLGYDEELPPELRRRFVATGTFHLFAISGTHMALLALLTAGVLRLAGISLVYWFPAVAPVLAVFTVMVGAPASAVRGSLMAALWLLGPLVGRRNDGASALALAGFLILLASPGELFSPGFILSFVTVAGLLCVAPFLTKAAEEDLPPVDPARERWRILAAGAWRYFRFCAAASAAAWLASMPLMAYWFNIWSPLTALANVPVIPLAAVALGLGFLAMLAGSIHPCLAAGFNWINIAPVTIIQAWLAFVQSLPFCQLLVKSPPVWAMLCWYAGLGVLVWRRQALPPALAGAAPPGRSAFECEAVVRRAGPRCWRDWRVMMALILLMAWPAWNYLDGRAGRVQLLNAGGVAVALGRGPGNPRHADWLVNAGSRRYVRRLAALLAAAGVNHLDLCFFTGMDAGHVSGALGLLESGIGPVREVIHPADAGRFRVFGALRGRLQQPQAVLRAVWTEEQGTMAGAMRWSVRPQGGASAMEAAIAWDDWQVRFIPAGIAEAAPRSMTVIAQSDRTDAVSAARVNANTAVAAGRRLEIRCAPDSFGERLFDGAAGPGISLDPGQVLTLDFNRRGLHLYWADDAP